MLRPQDDPKALSSLPGWSDGRSTNSAPTVRARATELVGRDDEVAVLQSWIDQAALGHGLVAVVEGEAGAGKSELLRHIGVRAAQDGHAVLTVRGDELEQDFAFGVVRQLAETGRRAGADAAAAALTAALDRADAAGGRGAVFGVLQQAYWLLVEIADRSPVVLLVDDAHWVDAASLQLGTFLAGRLDGVQVAAVFATRPGLLQTAAWRSGRAPAVTLRPLPPDQVATWLARDLGVGVDPLFAATAARVTGGNALLVHELVHEVRADGRPPGPAQVEWLRTKVPRGVARTLLVRLDGASADAVALADALAVLSDGDGLDLAGRLAGLTPPAAAAAAAELTRRGVLIDGPAVQVAHPMIRTAVAERLPAATRRALHARAAVLLHDRAAPPAVVAAHVVQSGDATPDHPWVPTALLAAGRQLMASGDAATAVRYLAAAADLTGDDVEVLLAWAQALAVVDPSAAVALLHRARDVATDAGRRARAVIALSHVQRFTGGGADAVTSLLETRAALPDDDPVTELIDSELLSCASMSASARRRLTQWRAAVVASAPASARPGWRHLVAATAALDGALDGRPRVAVDRDLTLALSGVDRVAEQVRGVVVSLAGLTAMLLDDVDVARAVFDRLVEETRDPGTVDRHAGMLAQRASLLHRLGDLPGALAEAQLALDLGGGGGANRTLLPRAAAVVVAVAAAQGTAAPMHLVTDDIDPDALAFRLLGYSRAELLAARGSWLAAAEAYERYGRTNVELGWRGVASPWRSGLALALTALGTDSVRAHDLVAEELHIARTSSVPRAVGVALTALGTVAAPDRRADVLTEAVDVLEDAPAPVERAQALAALGRHLLAQGRPREARARLTAAYDLAWHAAAHRLVEQLRPDLQASGARARRVPAPRRPTLTRAELTTATHAAQGLSNRRIAQTLFVTEKTVEAHLRASYRKLGVSARDQLPDALAAEAERA